MRTRVFDGKGGVAVCSYLCPSLRRPRRVFCFCAARQMRTGVFNGKGGAAVCRRKADGVADERRRQKEYAPQKRNMQKRKRPANTDGLCNCEVKRQPGTGFCGGKKKKPDVMSGFFTS